MRRSLLALHARLASCRDAGQGTLEYVGMIVAVAVVLALVIAVVRNYDLAARIQSAFDSVLTG